MGLWAIERERAVAGDGNAVVILGSSRVKSGLVPQALAEATGWETPIQLAINFSSPLLSLEHLAADPRFRGTAIVDVAPIVFFNAYWPLGNMVGGYLEHHASARWSMELEARLSVLLQSRFVFRLPELSGKHLPATLWRGELPAGQKFRDDSSRVTSILEQPAVPHAPLAGDGGAMPMGKEGLDKLIARVNAALAQLHSHGARAVFVATPTAGSMAELEARLFPREEYWDVFVRGIDAPAVYSPDHPELARFVPPDGSHLTVTQAPDFSRALGPLLAKALSKSERPAGKAP